MGVLVLGTVALDTVITPAGRRSGLLGGSAVHFSMSCRLFNRVRILAAVGDDFPSKYIHFLKIKGIDISSLRRCVGKTFAWTGDYCQDLNSASTLNTELGVFASFSPRLSHQEKKAKWIFLANLDPTIHQSVLQQIQKPKLLALDSMNHWIRNRHAVLLRTLKKIDIFFANEKEAKELSQKTNILQAAKELFRFGPRMVVIKKGEHGVLFYSNGFCCVLPAYPVEKVVDPTGAGDTFAGGFMGYLSQVGKVNAKTVKNALVYATVAASFNVEGFGLQRTASLTLGELKKRAAVFKRLVCW